MNSPAFQFYPKQWLGDDKVLAMDWDARAMHMHLLCIAWQQTPPCTLPDDDALIRRWLGNPRKWKVIKSQIFAAWKMIDGRWVQSGLLVQFEKQAAYRNTRKPGAVARWKNDAHAVHVECTTNALQSSSSKRTKTNTPPDEVLALYQAYPRHEAPGAAYRAIGKALKVRPFNFLMGAVQAYCRKVEREATEVRYRPLPATWFNAERYDDEDISPEKTPKIQWIDGEGKPIQ